MEDSHIAEIEHLDNGLALFGVFDGHGGKNFLNDEICYLIHIKYRKGSGFICERHIYKRI